MGIVYYIKKIIKFIFVDIWKDISWNEIFIICVLIIVSMTFIKFNIATYHVECGNGSIVEIYPGENDVCGKIIDLNAWSGFVEVRPHESEIFLNFSVVNFSKTNGQIEIKELEHTVATLSGIGSDTETENISVTKGGVTESIVTIRSKGIAPNVFGGLIVVNSTKTLIK